MNRILALSVACLLLGTAFAPAESKKEEIAKDLKTLKGKDEKAKISAIKEIADIGKLKAAYAADAVVPLTEILQKDESGKLRAEAAAALGAIDPEEYKPVVDALTEALKDKDDAVWKASATALGSLGAAKAKDSLPALKELSDKIKEKIDDAKDDKAKAKKLNADRKIVQGAIGALNGKTK